MSCKGGYLRDVAATVRHVYNLFRPNTPKLTYGSLAAVRPIVAGKISKVRVLYGKPILLEWCKCRDTCDKLEWMVVAGVC